MRRVFAIAAMDEGRVIGAHGRLPWHLPEDLKHFSNLTTGHTVMMGRTTYESLPEKFRPLPKRENIVVSRQANSSDFAEGVRLVRDPGAFLESFLTGTEETRSDLLWVIGGAQLYAATAPYWAELYLTVIHSRFPGDAYLPEFEASFELVDDDKRDGFSFRRYVKRIEALAR